MTDPNGRCRACLKPVLWARTELRNRWFALDPAPNPKGNQAAWQDSDGLWRTRQLGEGREPLWGFETVYMPHVATCEKQRPKPAPAALPPNVIPIGRAPSRERGATPRLKGT